MATQLKNPVNLEITTTTDNEEIINNPVLTNAFPDLKNGGELAGKLLFLFDSKNAIMFDNDGVYNYALFDMLYQTSEDVTVESIKIKTPATFTLSIDNA